MTSDLVYIIDKKTTLNYATPDLVEASLTATTIQKNYGIVGASTEYIVGFTLTNTIPANGIIRVYFPPSSAYNPSTGSIQCIDKLTSTTFACTYSL